MRSSIEVRQPISDLPISDLLIERSDVGADSVQEVETVFTRSEGFPRSHQDTAFDKSAGSGCSGIRTVNVEPCPTSLETDTRPFNISVNDLTI
jgi:hypothetical protein